MKTTILAVLVLSACAPAAPAVDNTFAAYARMLEQAGDANGVLVGGLGTPNPVDPAHRPFARTTSPMRSRMMLYTGIHDGEICFRESEKGGSRRILDAEEIAKRSLADAEARVELLSELPAARPLWPSSGSPLMFKKVLDDKMVEGDDGQKKRDVSWEECGPASAVSSDARYLAVIVHHTTPVEGSPADELLLWELR